MRNAHVRSGGMFLFMAALLFAGGAAWAQEVEPNSSCLTAQNLTAANLPYSLNGNIAPLPDVDFYRFTGSPGDTVRATVQAGSSGLGTLHDSLVGIYSGDCSMLLGYNDDSYDLDSQLEVVVPESGSFVVAVTSYADFSFTGNGYYSGSYRLTVEQRSLARSIAGKVIDAETGSPLSYAYITLYHCVAGSCNEWIGDTHSSYTGSFRFDAYNLYLPLAAGDYKIVVQAYNYQDEEVGPFHVSAGEDLELGEVPIDPVPRVGSISGRLVDLLTGAPLTSASVASGTAQFAQVDLDYCYYDWYCGPVRWAVPDAAGNFRFEGSSYDPLYPGTYRLRAYADQYETAVSPTFYVAGGQSYDFGDLRMKSFPVRIHLSESCGSIPASGGNCRFAMRVTNGSPSRLVGEAWSLITGGPLGSPAGYTTFQSGTPKGLSLAPGESAVLPFTFFVPADLQNGAYVCAEGFAAQRPHSFNTLGRHGLFCLYKGYGGFARVSDDQRREAERRSKGEDPRPPQGVQRQRSHQQQQ